MAAGATEGDKQGSFAGESYGDVGVSVHIVTDHGIRRLYPKWKVSNMEREVINVFDVGAELKALRISNGLTQQNVADIFGSSLSRVSKIENNRLEITAREYLEWKDKLLKIERIAAFTVTVDAGGSRGRVKA